MPNPTFLLLRSQRLFWDRRAWRSLIYRLEIHPGASSFFTFHQRRVRSPAYRGSFRHIRSPPAAMISADFIPDV